jgi:hypothetical protein
MDGPISVVERNPAVEWASRDAHVSPASAQTSPVVTRKTPTEPTIHEEAEGPDLDPKDRVSLPNDPARAVTVSADGVEEIKRLDLLPGGPNPHRISSVPTTVVERARHSLTGEFPRRGAEKGNRAVTHHQISEPLPNTGRREGAAVRNVEDTMLTDDGNSSPPAAGSSEPLSLFKHHSMDHLLAGSILQDSPDPLTPGEDKKLHSLDTVEVNPATVQTDDPAGKAAKDKASASASKKKDRWFSTASAPAEMGYKHEPLSASTPIIPSDTWDEIRKGGLLSMDKSIEEEEEDEEAVRREIIGDYVPPVASQSLPALSAPATVTMDVSEASIDNPEQQTSIQERRALPPLTLEGPVLDIEPTEETKEMIPIEQKDIPTGREQGWGTPFKIQWIRKDPLPFHRTRHLRNPWNHDVSDMDYTGNTSSYTNNFSA